MRDVDRPLTGRSARHGLRTLGKSEAVGSFGTCPGAVQHAWLGQKSGATIMNLDANHGSAVSTVDKGNAPLAANMIQPVNF